MLAACGLREDAATSTDGADEGRLEIIFPSYTGCGLKVTHAQIGNVGRMPYLLAAGFKGHIVCSEASVRLMPLMLKGPRAGNARHIQPDRAERRCQQGITPTQRLTDGLTEAMPWYLARNH